MTPRALGPGAHGCRTSAALGSQTTFLVQVGLQAFTPVPLVSFALPAWVPLALLLFLNHAEVSRCNPQCI